MKLFAGDRASRSDGDESIYAKLQDAGPLIPKKMAAKAAFGGRLRTICSGGAYLDPEYIDKFKDYGITILQGYGMTECSPVISTNLEWAAKKKFRRQAASEL